MRRTLTALLLLVALTTPAWAASPTRIFDLDSVELPQVGLSMIVDSPGFDRAQQLALADLGSTHTHTASQLTDLTASAAELNLLDGATATAGGLLFGDGTKLTQSAGLLRWDSGASRLEAQNIKVLTGGNLTVESGKLGVATTAPEYALQVGTKFAVGTDGVVRWGGDVRNATYGPAGYLSYSGTKTLVGGLAGQHLGLVAGAAEKATLTTAGKFGIGSTNPDDILTVKPSVAGDGISLHESDDLTRYVFRVRSYTDGAELYLFNGTTSLFKMDSTSGAQNVYWLGGNWGLGTNDPQARLHLYRVADRADFRIERATTSAAELGAVQFNGLDSGSTSTTYAQIVGKSVTTTHGAERGALAFELTVNGSSALKADLTFDGFKLESGARINEFSTDGTMAGNSDIAVPTEQAVKTYCDVGGWSAAPASASATGTAGQKAYDADYYYQCTAANTWKRVAIATW